MNIEKGSFWTDQAANYQVVDVVGSDVFLKDGGGSVSKLKKNLTSKIFGYLARCEEDLILAWPFKIEILNFWSKFDENADIDSAKIWKS